MLIMRNGRRKISDGIEQTNEEKVRKLGKRKLTSTWEY